MYDFVFPEGNEEEFISMAKRLGYSEICFVYSLKDFKRFESDFKVYTAVMEDKNFDKARQRADFVIAKAGEDVRRVIESGKVDFIYGFEEGAKKDLVHYRNSGLNQVLCKLMKEKNAGYFLSLTHLLESKDPQFLGRVMQNIKLCNKYGVRIGFGSFAVDVLEMRALSDVKALMKILGVSSLP
ncbi:hypothetical protein KY345_00320 [Candidatus Woesearchaeota archaeon]|nr:hypothetical protein [Candidatus Woesearchaeota archaeon]